MDDDTYRIAKFEKTLDRVVKKPLDPEVQRLFDEKNKSLAEAYMREGQLKARLASQERALRNCLLLASRNRKEEWARHVIRFCADAGVKPSVLRTQIEGEGEE